MTMAMLAKTALLIIGIVAFLAGLIFLGQGSGNFPYPASSFMIGQTQWIYRGAGLALGGLLLTIVSRLL
jgi:hypothetical protein